MTSTRIMIGPEHDITTTPYSDRHARRVELAHPVLMPRELQAFRHLSYLVRRRTYHSLAGCHLRHPRTGSVGPMLSCFCPHFFR